MHSPMIFSQLPTVTSEQLGVWMACLAAAVLMADKLKNWFIRTPPIEAEFVNKKEFAAFQMKTEANLRDMQTLILTKIEGMDKKDEERSVLLHNRVNDLLAAVSRLEGKVKK